MSAGNILSTNNNGLNDDTLYLANSSHDLELQTSSKRALALSQFLEFTGHPNVNNEAERILASCGWDPEIATVIYFTQHDEQTTGNTHHSIYSESLLPEVIDYTMNDSHNDTSQVYTPELQESMSSVPANHMTSFNNNLGQRPTDLYERTGIMHRIVLPIRLLGHKLLDFSNSIFSMLHLIYYSISSAIISSPGVVPTHFNMYFTQQFGTGPKPEFYTGTFMQAMQAARNSHRVLIVYIHHDRARFSNCIAQFILQNPTFLQMIDTDAIIWGIESKRYEAAALTHRLLHCREFPHLSFLVPIESHSIASMTQGPLLTDHIRHSEEFHVVGSIEGDVRDANRAIALFTMALDKIQEHVTQEMSRHQQLEEDRRIRAEQKEAYQEALRKDNELALRQKYLQQELEEKNKNDEQIKHEQIEIKRLKTEAEQQLLLKRWENSKLYLESEIRQYLQLLAIESDQLHPPIYSRGHNKQDIFIIRLRLPNGHVIERQFSKSAHLLDVFLWVDSLPILFNTTQRDDTFQMIYTHFNINHQLINNSDIISKICGTIIPGQSLIQIPLHYYLSTSLPVQKFYRPVNSHRPDQSVTLNELGFINHNMLFLHESVSSSIQSINSCLSNDLSSLSSIDS